MKLIEVIDPIESDIDQDDLRRTTKSTLWKKRVLVFICRETAAKPGEAVKIERSMTPCGKTDIQIDLLIENVTAFRAIIAK